MLLVVVVVVVMMFKTSIAISVPITPTTGPKIPISEHVCTVSGAGAVGKMQR